MSIRTGKLTVFFEEPFWVGIFERVENGKLSVSKVTFGTEPKDYEIWEFVLKEYDRLQFSPSVEVTAKELTKNPKKLQREIHKQMLDRGVGTKSQQALKLQQEQRKQHGFNFWYGSDFICKHHDSVGQLSSMFICNRQHFPVKLL